MNFDTTKISAVEAYHLLVGAVVPRPIAWVSTLSTDGVANVAPHSFFTVASCAPPVLAFTHVSPRNGHEKDTLRNLRATRQCVVNIVSHQLAEKMNASSGDYPSNVSEFESVGIKQVASARIAPPAVAEAKVRFECTLRDIITVSDLPLGGHLVLLDVVEIFVSDSVLREGRIDAENLDAIARMGGDIYATTRDRFEIKRPKIGR